MRCAGSAPTRMISLQSTIIVGLRTAIAGLEADRLETVAMRLRMYVCVPRPTLGFIMSHAGFLIENLTAKGSA